MAERPEKALLGPQMGAQGPQRPGGGSARAGCAAQSVWQQVETKAGNEKGYLDPILTYPVPFHRSLRKNTNTKSI